MEPDLSLPPDLPADSDELFVMGQGKVPYPIRRRRAVAAAVTVAWLILLGAVCAYLLGKA